MRRPKRRTARKRRSVRAACRGKPLEAAGCSNGPTPDALGCSKTAVRPKRPSVRSDGLSERLRCLGMKIVLLGCEDCAARVCVEMLTAMVCCTGRAGRGEPGLANRLPCFGPAGVGRWSADIVGQAYAS